MKISLLIRSMLASFALAQGMLAANLNLNPSIIPNNYSGSITLDIAGLDLDQTVTVERYLDVNNNGAIDAEDLLLQSFNVTDNQTASVAGVRNLNIPGDEDGGLARQIRTVINVRLAELNQLSGQFLIRLASPAGAFDPEVKVLLVFPVAASERITGTVLSGDKAVPYALVVAHDLTADSVRASAAADANGTFNLSVPSGVYRLLPMKPGLAAEAAALPTVIVRSGDTAITNLNLVAGTNFISGKLQETGTNSGVPAVQLFLTSESGAQSMGFTDSNGVFNLPVTAGQWSIQPNAKTLAMLGLANTALAWKANTSTGDVSNLILELPRATALIYGTVKNTFNRSVFNLELSAQGTNSESLTLAFSDPLGGYVLGVIAGEWLVEPVLADMNARGLFGGGVSLTVTNDEARLLSFVFPQATTHARGKVIDQSGAPVVGLDIQGWNFQNLTAQARSGVDGQFDLRVSAGRWYVQVDPVAAGSQGLLSEGIILEIQDGEDRDGITLKVAPISTRVRGMLVDQSGAAVDNLGVLALDEATGLLVYQSTQADGGFDFALAGGNWSLLLDEVPAMNRHLIGPRLALTLTNGLDVSNVLWVAQTATSSLKVSVTTVDSTNLAGMPVFLDSDVNGTNYHREGLTGTNGTAVFAVFAGNWKVAISAAKLLELGYEVAPEQTVTVSDAEAAANFIVQYRKVAEPPQLRALGFVAEGFGLSITGESLREYRLDGSTNLVDWAEIARFTMDQSATNYIDTSAKDLLKQFYRVVVLK